MKFYCCPILGIHRKIDGSFWAVLPFHFLNMHLDSYKHYKRAKYWERKFFQCLWAILLAWKLLLSKWLLCCRNLWKVLRMFQLRGCYVPSCWDLILTKGFLWLGYFVGSYTQEKGICFCEFFDITRWGFGSDLSWSYSWMFRMAFLQHS